MELKIKSAKTNGQFEATKGTLESKGDLAGSQQCGCANLVSAPGRQMNLTPDDITIAITVFDRRQFLKQAIASALEQKFPVRVMVVEDCGPDPGLQTFVKQEFGDRVEYIRNS